MPKKISKKKNYKVIGGWLILPILGLIITIGLNIYNVFDYLILFDGEWAEMMNPTGIYPSMTFPLVAYEFAIFLAYAGFAAFFLVSAIMRKKFVPKWIVYFYAYIVLTNVIDVVVGSSIVDFDDETLRGMVKSITQSITTVIVWGLYFKQSERVRKTFVIGKELGKRAQLVVAAIALVPLAVLGVVSAYQSNSSEGLPEGVSEQDNLRMSVVNILCPYADDEFSIDSGGSGGSGTITSEDGAILTNAHIFPQNDTDYLTHEEGCFVSTPSPKTGEQMEIYLAQPYSVEGWSELYDIAYLEIYAPYVDEDGVVWGEEDKKFANIGSAPECSISELELGDPITILGYPSLSGGLNLTLTEGVVSGFSLEEGVILTSAQVSPGNSGGLALNEDGCMVGIPSTYYSDEGNSFGGIISIDLLLEFNEAVEEPYSVEAAEELGWIF